MRRWVYSVLFGFGLDLLALGSAQLDCGKRVLIIDVMVFAEGLIKDVMVFGDGLTTVVMVFGDGSESAKTLNHCKKTLM